MKEKYEIEKEQIPTENLIKDFAFGVFRIRTDGTPVSANNSFMLMLGFSSFEELTQHWEMNEGFRECFSSQKYSARLAGNSPTDPFENKWINRHGKSVLMRETCKPVYSEQEELLFYDCIAEDITEPVIIDKLIKDIIAGDYSILHALPDLLFVLTRDGRFIDYRSNYQKLFVNKFQLKGQSVRSVFPEAISDQIITSIEAALNSGGIEIFEFNLQSQTETEYFEARFVIAGHDVVLMILRDISKQKQAEIQYKKFTEELKRLNATKDKFFSIVSHDLRAPINGLLGYAELLSKEIDSMDKDEIKLFAGNIAEISKSTNTLLSNILDWSRIQTGRIYFHPQTTDVSKSVQRILNLLNAAAANKDISLVSAIEEGLMVFADENMLQSIFINLIGNAIKFTHNGGQVAIDGWEEENCFHFTVKDSGIGIDESDIEKLFNSEIIYSTNGTAKENGTGLGLLLCKEFVDKHSGSIWVESEKRKGSIFHFTLPGQVKSENLLKV
ncbi:MAG: hypothetical protein CVV24_05835 [Ignavibacteriae bacterium HGW-Ignavibacteriae-3]|nr:MAG: hypothetical protein CVV24_05835 [Ignavibacteriae bacterium HGW-Ignavibacteriae-3]